MIPHVIKYVSADGLTKYESRSQRHGRPDGTLRRLAYRRLRVETYDVIPPLSHWPTVKREYTYSHSYTDETNGNLVFEYHEVL